MFGQTETEAIEQTQPTSLARRTIHNSKLEPRDNFPDRSSSAITPENPQDTILPPVRGKNVGSGSNRQPSRTVVAEALRHYSMPVHSCKF